MISRKLIDSVANVLHARRIELLNGGGAFSRHVVPAIAMLKTEIEANAQGTGNDEPWTANLLKAAVAITRAPKPRDEHFTELHLAYLRLTPEQRPAMPRESLKKIEDALDALKKQGADLEAVLDAIGSHAFEDLMNIRRQRCLSEPQFVERDGFAPLAPLSTDIWIDAAYCAVLARKGEDGRRSYLVIGRFGEDQSRVIGTATRAPDSQMLGECLVNAGLLRTKPLPGHEWAVNVDGNNPFESNFPAEELRDCAIDEFILDGRASEAEDNVVCLFEIAPNGYQDSDAESFANLSEWAEERGIDFPNADATEVPGRVKV